MKKLTSLVMQAVVWLSLCVVGSPLWGAVLMDFNGDSGVGSPGGPATELFAERQAKAVAERVARPLPCGHHFWAAKRWPWAFIFAV